MTEPQQERFRFSVVHLMGLVLIIGIVLGTLRLLVTVESVPARVLAVTMATLVVLVLIFRIASQAMTWIQIGVSTGIVALLASWLFPAFYFSLVSARTVGCRNNLKQIGIAMHNYHDEHGCFPPAYIADAGGKPIHSWRVLLLPYLEQDGLYRKYRFDEPWDGPNNRKLHAAIVDTYSCPEQRARSSRAAATETSYVVVVGPQTAFPGDRCVSLSQIRDGPAYTLTVVEIKDSGVHWMEPRDLHVTQMNPRINPPRGQGISSHHGHGAHAVTADGAVRYLTDDLSPSELTGLFTINGGEPWPEPKSD
jgi:uncharacterized protein DUF1559